MKVTITVKVKAISEPNSTLETTVGELQTAANLKSKVSTMALIPFPKQDLIFNGKVIDDDSILSDCGVMESSSLDLEVHASEFTLLLQITDLLQARDLAIDELSLLYSYKYGTSVNQALKFIGHEGKLNDFVGKQNKIFMENGKVALVRENTALKPFSVANEVEEILKASGSPTMEIKELCSKFAKKYGVSLSSIVGSRPAEFLVKENKLFKVNGLGAVSLKSSDATSKQRSESPINIGAPPGLSPAGLADPEDSKKAEKKSVQEYCDLHNQICSGFFQGDISKAVNDIIAAIAEASLLNIHHIVTGGSVGKGTAILGKADADVVLFVCGLPKIGHAQWLPPLLCSVAQFLTGGFDGDHAVESVCVSQQSIRMVLKGLVSVDLYISPVFESYIETIQVLSEQELSDQKYYAASLAKERTKFLARQPSQVKMTIRLMRWWRDQQEWSSQLTRPSDDILELMAVYSAIQTKPTDQKAAIANLMSLLSGFKQLRIVWSNYYKKDDVEAPLLQQRPLLMDPANPSVNVADPSVFDPSELMAFAQNTRFFW